MKKIKLICSESSVKLSGKDVKIKRDDLEVLYAVLSNTGTKDTSDFRSKLKLRKAVEKVLEGERKEHADSELLLPLMEYKTLEKIMEDYKSQVIKQGKNLGDDVMYLIVQIEEAEQINDPVVPK